jgi:hypothetical protein
MGSFVENFFLNIKKKAIYALTFFCFFGIIVTWIRKREYGYI